MQKLVPEERILYVRALNKFQLVFLWGIEKFFLKFKMFYMSGVLEYSKLTPPVNFSGCECTPCNLSINK